MKRFYLDSSVLLAVLLREISADLGFDRNQELVTSELTDLECRRTLDRIRIEERLPNEELSERLSELDAILRTLRIIHLGAPILRRAKAPFPTVVRSLDAIHLATAELSAANVFISRDR